MFGKAVAGDRHPEAFFYSKSLVRVPTVRVPLPLYLLGQFFKLLGKLLWWLGRNFVRFWWASVPAALVIAGFWWLGWEYATAAVVVVVLGLVGWWWKARSSFWRLLGRFYLAQLRRWFVYRRRWYATCTNLGLACAFDGERYYPTIVKVRRDQEGDLVTVRMLDGQHPNDYGKNASRFAYTFNALGCMVRPAGGRRRDRIVLHLRMRDSLAATIVPFAVPAVPDLNALPVAAGPGGRKVVVSLLTHVLIAGASGSGKGSVLWAILSALGSAIRNGLVRVYAFDPKGGVELHDGRTLFHRFYFSDPADMAEALEELVALMRRRQASQRGKGRTHQATVEEPAVVIVIDEFGALTAYVGDKKIKERIVAAMSLILSQGRAIGVHVVAALQDPRKEILPFRNLFGSRIALRLNEESEVGMVLDDDAVERGAACHEIPKSMPGVGYMILEDQPQPVRLRFPYHTDEDIKNLAERYRPAINGAVVDARAIDVKDAAASRSLVNPAYEVNR